VSGKLLVSEVFGPTVQGEGPAAGRRCAFLRLGRCNLDCWWCDTRYSWDADSFDLDAELAELETAAVFAELVKRCPELAVITGGEPLLQRAELAALVTLLVSGGTQVHIETNGTIPPGPKLSRAVQLFVISPKLPSARVDQRKAIRPLALGAYAELARHFRAVLKFVCTSAADVAAAAELADEHGFARDRCWIMPEGTTPDAVAAGLRDLADAAISAGMNLTGRTHVTVWGNERGR
jgi:organic radical activating enzyme